MELLLENHWLACMATAGGGGRVTRMPGALVVTNPRVATMFLNFMTLRDADPAGLGAVLELGSAVLAGWQRPPALFLSPAAGDMTAHADALLEMGWRLHTRQAVLARDLPLTGAETPADVFVREIGPGDLATWGQILVDAYGVAPGTGQEIKAGWTTLMAEPGEGSRARYYLAWQAGKPVGTGLTWTQGAVAGLYCGAVLPDFRRRGVLRAAVLRRLSQAAADGALVATLQTEVGSPVEHLCVDRFGFRVAHHRELWLPPILP